MLPLVKQALISGASSLIGGVSNAIQSRKNVKDTIQHQKDESELQYQRNLEMWNMQNEYNSPAKQMERFKKAGLNPNLIYGRGAAAAGNASEMPKYQAAKGDYSGRMSFVTPFAEAAKSVLGDYYNFRALQDKHQMDKQQLDIRERGMLVNEADQKSKDTLRYYQGETERHRSATEFVKNFREKGAVYAGDYHPFFETKEGRKARNDYFDSLQYLSHEEKARADIAQARASIEKLNAQLKAVGVSPTESTEMQALAIELMNNSEDEEFVRRSLIAAGVAGKAADLLMKRMQVNIGGSALSKGALKKERGKAFDEGRSIQKRIDEAYGIRN